MAAPIRRELGTSFIFNKVQRKTLVRMFRCWRNMSTSQVADFSEVKSPGLCFDLSEDDTRIRDLARKFARENVLPAAAHLDRTGEFPSDLLRQAWEIGLTTCKIPEKYGGLGVGLLPTCLMAEELSYACAGFYVALIASVLGQTPLILHGSDEQKRKYLGRCVEEPITVACAVTESSSGSDVASIRTKAVKKGNEYILNGSKMWITGAGEASWYFVLARTVSDPKTPAGNSMSGFIVESDWEGVTRGKKEKMMGIKCSNTAGVTFEDVRVPEENRVLGEGDGFKITMETFDRTRPYVAAGGTGIAKRALDEATKYSLERQAFGTHIANHQAVAFMLADMAVQAETAHMLTLKSAWEFDQGRNATYDASIAKLFASNAACLNATNAVQIFGGAGYCNDYPVEKLMRDAKIFEIFEGTSQIQRIVISRDVLRRAKLG